VTLEPRFKVIGEEESGQWSMVNGQWSMTSDQRPTTNDEGPMTHFLPTGICGSGIIEAVAEMFLAGIIGADGRFLEAAAGRSERVRFNGRTGEYILVDAHLSATGREIVVTQNDVRAIQLAKAALYAGVKLLMNQRQAHTIDRIVLAGAFGSYISPRHAMILGLIPDCELSQVTAVGNAAGDGARIALLNREQRREAAHLVPQIEYVETAVAPAFQEEFVAAMALPHAHDPFPHLEGIIPARTVEGRRRRR
jgi:uncharacterized 2Fe-2S/4Fe-4S cluster protein (DUF4445 family)